MSSKRKKDEVDVIQELQVEQEQPKSKKLKANEPSSPTESETRGTAKPIQNQDKSGKKKKKNKKRLERINEKTIVTDSHSPAIKQAIEQATKKLEENSSAKNDTRESNPSADNTPKKKSKNKKQLENNSLAKNETQETNPPGNNLAKKKKKKKKNKNKSSAGTKVVVTPAKKTNKKSTTVRGLDISDDRLKAYGIRNPKKFKNAMIYGNLTKS